MIYRSKAPLRIGLAGGGTDVSPYCDVYGGAILNASISLYAYASIEPLSTPVFNYEATDRGSSFSLALENNLPINGELDLAKGVYNKIVSLYGPVPSGFTLKTYVDAAAGSGLGSSSTLVVAILGAFAEWMQIPLGEYDAAHLAYQIERVDLNMAGGKQDQYAAAFLRWVWQPAHAEFYTEWGRNDTYYTMRDFIQQPEHSRAYTYGFRKLFGSALKAINTNSFIKTPKHYWQFISEYTRTQQPSTWPVRTAGSWYVRGDMPGYTQMGQIMGAPIGSGGNYQMMRISKFNGWKQIGFQLESTTHTAENFEASGLAFTNPSLTKWVDYGFRILYDYPYKHFLFSTTLAATRSFNYNWSQPANATGLGLGNPNDLDSYLLKFAIRFL